MGREPPPRRGAAGGWRVTMGGGVASCREADDVVGSVIAGLDPRTRLLSAVGFIVGVVSLQSPLPLVLAVLVALAAVMLARLPWASLRHRLPHVEGFMLALMMLLPFTTPGRPLLSLGPVSLTEEGLLIAATIALKVNASVLAVFALLGSLEPVRLGHAAVRLGVPLKLAHLFLFVVRFVGVLRAEAGRLLDAMRARAFVARSNRHTWRALGNLAGMLLVRSLDRAERVEEAMRCRGFSGRFPLVDTGVAGRHDLAFTVAACLAILVLLAADRLA